MKLGIAAFTFAGVLLLNAQDDLLPEGKGKDIVLKTCSGNCHDISQATTQKFSKLRWMLLINDMIGRGAVISDNDVNTIVVYLSQNFGKPVNINKATAKELENGLSFTAAESEALVKHRESNGALKDFAELAAVPGLNQKLIEEQKPNIQF